MNQEYWKKRRRNLRDYSEDKSDNSDKSNSFSKYYKRHSGDLWEKNRKKAKKRDNFQCVKCGITDEQHKESQKLFGDGNHVHHIKPVRKFNELEEAHKLENLVTLCDKHHKQAENSQLVVDSPQPGQ